LNKSKIAKKLKELRGDKNPIEVAEALKISSRALSSYELGERIPRDEVKKRIADYYHLTVQEIFFN